MRKTRRRRAAGAASLLTAAVAAAPAQAATDETGGIVLRRDGSKAVEVVTVPEPTGRAGGFDWRDAAIGAGAGTAALVLASAGAHAARRQHTNRRHPLAASGSRGGER
jgi:hypothetical protein